MKCIRIGEVGGADVLRTVNAETSPPGPGEVLLRHTAIGVNFIDTYHRSGLYRVPLPTGIGLEAVGVIEACGADVTRFREGERVGYCSGPIGAYAESHLVPADRVFRIPEAIPHHVAAAVLLKGMTARFLIKQTYPLQPGHIAVIHAAAGGVGQIALQWSKRLGATVIAVVGDEAKAEIARALGADHVLVSSRDDIAERVREITSGVGADVVYDSVGRDTFEASLNSLRLRGTLVSFGNSSGPPPDFAPSLLAQKGSLFLTRPTLFHYIRTEVDLQQAADDLFSAMSAGVVRIREPTRYALVDAASAHRDLEGRKTTGSIVLMP